MRTGGGLPFHGANLYRGSMGAQKQAIAQRFVLLVGDDKRVLGIARRVVRRKIQRFKIVVVGFHFGSDTDRVAHVFENTDDFLHGANQRVLRAKGWSDSGERDIDPVGVCRRSGRGC